MSNASIPVHHFPLPLSCYHVQQGLAKVVSDAAITNHLIPKDDEPQVVDVFNIVLLHINSILWHKKQTRELKVLRKIFCFKKQLGH